MIFVYAFTVLCVFAIAIVFLIRRQINFRMTDDFLSAEECQYFIDRASLYLEKNHQTMGDNASRTSTPVYLESNDDVVMAVRLRAASYLNIPEGNLERLQVVRYTLTQEYHGHTDWFPGGKVIVDMPTSPDGSAALPYQRTSTILVYLNDVLRGGQTSFPYLRKKVTPKAGTAVSWCNLWPNGKGNWLTFHAAMPVTKGMKWAVNIWAGDRDIQGAYAEYFEEQKIKGVGPDFPDTSKSPNKSEQ